MDTTNPRANMATDGKDYVNEPADPYIWLRGNHRKSAGARLVKMWEEYKGVESKGKENAQVFLSSSNEALEKSMWNDAYDQKCDCNSDSVNSIATNPKQQEECEEHRRIIEIQKMEIEELSKEVASLRKLLNSYLIYGLPNDVPISSNHPFGVEVDVQNTPEDETDMQDAVMNEVYVKDAMIMNDNAGRKSAVKDDVDVGDLEQVKQDEKMKKDVHPLGVDVQNTMKDETDMQGAVMDDVDMKDAMNDVNLRSPAKYEVDVVDLGKAKQNEKQKGEVKLGQDESINHYSVEEFIRIRQNLQLRSNQGLENGLHGLKLKELRVLGISRKHRRWDRDNCTQNKQQFWVGKGSASSN